LRPPGLRSRGQAEDRAYHNANRKEPDRNAPDRNEDFRFAPKTRHLRVNEYTPYGRLNTFPIAIMLV